MKFNLFLISVFCLFITAKAQKIKIELEFKYKQPYCGSAKPTADMIAEADKEKPLDNQKFYVYQNDKCIDTIKTNDLGTVIIKYLPGTYFLFEPWKQFKKTPDASPISDFNKTCLAKEWLKPNYKITINNETDFKMDYYEISASRCAHQLACLKVRHLPSIIKRK